MDNASVEKVINRLMQLREWEVVVKVPDEFQFYGVVPFSMNITNGVAYVKVVAMTLEEAMEKAKRYFDGPQEEGQT